VTVEIINHAPDDVRIFATQLWFRTPKGAWGFIGQTNHDWTNALERRFRVELDAPDWRPQPWRASVIYMPRIKGAQLLRLRWKEYWRSRSLEDALELEGWQGERRANSKELSD